MHNCFHKQPGHGLAEYSAIAAAVAIVVIGVLGWIGHWPVEVFTQMLRPFH